MWQEKYCKICLTNKNHLFVCQALQLHLSSLYIGHLEKKKATSFLNSILEILSRYLMEFCIHKGQYVPFAFPHCLDTSFHLEVQNSLNWVQKTCSFST